MKPVKMKVEGRRARTFKDLKSAIEWMNRTLEKDKLEETVTVRMPKWEKDRLRREKELTGVPMSKQVLARHLNSRRKER